jgi:hypothetical protein
MKFSFNSLVQKFIESFKITSTFTMFVYTNILVFDMRR